MTLCVGVTDDQLGQYYRRVNAIAGRLEKSVDFKYAMEVLQLLHDGTLDVVGMTNPKRMVVEPAPEPPLDFLVHVDRQIKPPYPTWVGKVVDPELECAGPSEYDLQETVLQWIYDDQDNSDGMTIYHRLKASNLLGSCLNLQDARAIQKKGIAVFRKLFGKEKAVFFWGSVVLTEYDSRMDVPVLHQAGDKLALDWRPLGNFWRSEFPALYFKSGGAL